MRLSVTLRYYLDKPFFKINVIKKSLVTVSRAKGKYNATCSTLLFKVPNFVQCAQFFFNRQHLILVVFKSQLHNKDFKDIHAALVLPLISADIVRLYGALGR